MDIQIPQEDQKKQSLLLYIKLVGLMLLALATIWSIRNFISPKVDYRSLQTAQVQWGPIEASLTATGTVMPEFEQSISSPIQAQIDSVYFNAGTLVKAGTAILKLDLSYAQLELEKLEEGLQKKKNEANLIRLRMEKNLAELQSQYDIKKLKIKSLESEFSNVKHLASIGGGTQDDVRQSELNLHIAKRELQQLEAQILNQQQTNKADLASLSYEIRIEEKSINELHRRMQQAEIRAERDGVIVYVKDKLGTLVTSGEEVVRIADLNKFKVIARLSEAYASELQIGGRVKVRAGSNDLAGTIASVKPEVSNGQVSFEISLLENDAPMLRPNLQVDVMVITAFKDHTLTVKNGAFFKGKLDQKVFVVYEDKAIAKKASIGLSNLDMVEISGLKAGEELIISDMSKFDQADEVRLINQQQ